MDFPVFKIQAYTMYLLTAPSLEELVPRVKKADLKNQIVGCLKTLFEI